MQKTDATHYAEINELLELLLTGIQTILGQRLIGLYLYGSLVIGDFDPNSSDIDLIAALSTDINDKELEELQKMHTDFAIQQKEWVDRIEVCYISLAALHTVKTRTSQIANISPGEAFHRRESSREWLTDWYVVREAFRDQNVDHDASYPETLRFVRFAINQCESASGDSI